MPSILEIQKRVPTRSFVPQQAEKVDGVTSSRNERAMPRSALINRVVIDIDFNYSVGATAPTGMRAGGIYNMLKSFVIDSNRPGDAFWNILGGVNIKEHMTMLKGKRVPIPTLDLTTNGGTKSASVKLVAELVDTHNPFSIYDTGGSTYFKDIATIINWGDYNSDGGIFAAVNTFAIDKSSIQVRYTYHMHQVPADHPARTNPENFRMRCLETNEYQVTETGVKNIDLLPKRDHLALHIMALNENANALTVDAAVLAGYDAISLNNSNGSTSNAFYVTSNNGLKDHTVDFRDIEYSEVEAGNYVLPVMDDHRAVQGIYVDKEGDVVLKFNKLTKNASGVSRLEITGEFMVDQDKPIATQVDEAAKASK